MQKIDRIWKMMRNGTTALAVACALVIGSVNAGWTEDAAKDDFLEKARLDAEKAKADAQKAMAEAEKAMAEAEAVIEKAEKEKAKAKEEKAKAMENNCKSGDPESAFAMLDEIETDFAQTMLQLKAYLASFN